MLHTVDKILQILNAVFLNLCALTQQDSVCVYRLYLLLVLASAVIIRSESRKTHYHILLPKYEMSQAGGASIIFGPQEHGGPIIPRENEFSCRLHSMSRMATVESSLS